MNDRKNYKGNRRILLCTRWDKTVYECKAKGIFRNKKIKPLVGDNVEITILDEAECEGNIDQILPRKNSLIRPAVANVDQALVVFSILHPEPNLNLLDRFLVMMKYAEVPVSILFNKVDLSDEAIIEKYRKIYEPAGYEVLFSSTYEETGIDMIRGLLRGKTTVLAGPSGVGKSSLINMIQPEQAWRPVKSARRFKEESIPQGIPSCFILKKILIPWIRPDSVPCLWKIWKQKN